MQVEKHATEMVATKHHPHVTLIPSEPWRVVTIFLDYSPILETFLSSTIGSHHHHQLLDVITSQKTLQHKSQSSIPFLVRVLLEFTKDLEGKVQSKGDDNVRMGL